MVGDSPTQLTDNGAGQEEGAAAAESVGGRRRRRKAAAAAALPGVRRRGTFFRRVSRRGQLVAMAMRKSAFRFASRTIDHLT